MKHDKYRMCYKGHLIVSFNNFEFIDATPKGLRAALQANSAHVLQTYEIRCYTPPPHRIVLFNKPTLPQSLGFHRNGLRALCSVEHERERERGRDQADVDVYLYDV